MKIPNQISCCITLNNRVIITTMKSFGETVRELRVAQDLGLREAAVKAGISPAYLSRIERDKESPPRPELIKELALILAADPDVLFRLASSTDPEIVIFLREQPSVMNLLRYIISIQCTKDDINKIMQIIEKMHSSGKFGDAG